MSRQLPARPNLEFLKKQAKDLLPGVQRRDPSAQLSDAQHQLAREYGFDSWPKLKLHVESLELPPLQSPFVGDWVVNKPKSVQHPLNGDVTDARMSIAVSGNELTIRDIVVRGGKTDQHANVLKADGIEHAVPERAGYTMQARWRGTRTVEFVLRIGGEIAGQGSYEISPDGRTLTIKGDQQVAVFDRRVN